MKIRLANTDDIDQVLPLFVDLDTKHSLNNKDIRSIIPDDRYKRIFQDVFKRESILILTVVEIEQKIIGFSLAKISKIHNNLILKNQIIGEILYIAIDESSKKKGIGRALMNDIEDRLTKRGATKLELRVFNFNEETLPEKLNYQPKYTVYEKYFD